MCVNFPKIGIFACLGPPEVIVSTGDNWNVRVNLPKIGISACFRPPLLVKSSFVRVTRGMCVVSPKEAHLFYLVFGLLLS